MQPVLQVPKATRSPLRPLEALASSLPGNFWLVFYKRVRSPTALAGNQAVRSFIPGPRAEPPRVRNAVRCRKYSVSDTDYGGMFRVEIYAPWVGNVTQSGIYK